MPTPAAQVFFQLTPDQQRLVWMLDQWRDFREEDLQDQKQQQIYASLPEDIKQAIERTRK